MNVEALVRVGPHSRKKNKVEEKAQRGFLVSSGMWRCGDVMI